MSLEQNQIPRVRSHSECSHTLSRTILCSKSCLMRKSEGDDDELSCATDATFSKIVEQYPNITHSRSPYNPERIRRQMMRVYLHIKPAPKIKIADNERWFKVMPNGTFILKNANATSASQLVGLSKPKSLKLTFHRVFCDILFQMRTVEILSNPGLDQLMHGGNGLIVAVGSPNAGKTHTMVGRCGDNRGLVYRCLLSVLNSTVDKLAGRQVIEVVHPCGFKLKQSLMPEPQYAPAAAAHKKRDGISDLGPDNVNDLVDADYGRLERRYAVFLTMLEIHGDFIYDLLDGKKSSKRSMPLTLREDPQGRVYAFTASRIEVCNISEAMQVFRRGQRRLAFLSGRSHLIVKIILAHAPFDHRKGKFVFDRPIYTGELVLADLLSPRSGDADSTMISKSLFTLHSCLNALRANQKAIIRGQPARKIPPIRESKLTQLFKHFFDIAMPATVVCVTCITQNPADILENVRALRFAETSKEIEPNIFESLDSKAPSTSTCNSKSHSLVLTQPPPPLATVASNTVSSLAEFNDALLPPMRKCLGPIVLLRSKLRGSSRFLTETYRLDFDAITCNQQLWIPPFNQVGVVIKELQNLIDRRHGLLNLSEFMWSPTKCQRVLNAAPSTKLRLRIIDTVQAQKVAIEMLQTSLEEQHHSLAELRLIYDDMRYDEFCKKLQRIEQRTATLENMLLARNEQLERYMCSFGMVPEEINKAFQRRYNPDDGRGKAKRSSSCMPTVRRSLCQPRWRY